MVAVLVFAVGLLGVAALQAAALRNSQSSLERSQAVIHSYAILDAMRANLNVARAGGYNTDALVCAPPGGGASLANNDIDRWLNSVQQGLGDDACGQIQCDIVAGSISRDCVITLQWNDSRATEGAAAQQVQTETRI